MTIVWHAPDIDARALAWILLIGKGNFPPEPTAARYRA
jgi:hypothetical protein